MLLRNAWYIAAWSDELGAQPLARRICNEPIVLFRDKENHAAALADRCCHRAAPLHLGTVIESGIQCGYHGLVFDGSGRCVMIPEQKVQYIPYATCKMVPEEHCHMVTCRRCYYVTEVRCQLIPYTTCKMVPEEHVTSVPVTTCHMEPYCVTRKVCRKVPVYVPVTAFAGTATTMVGFQLTELLPALAGQLTAVFAVSIATAAAASS